MALTADTPLVQELGAVSEYPVLAATRIYEGAAVGLYVSNGQARGLVAGDLFLGFCESQVDNRDDAVGAALNVRVLTRGKVELTVGSLAATDVGEAVYASADGTFTLTPGSNSFIGYVERYVSAGVGIVKFDAVLVQGPSTES
jgi:hypothetical protein